MLKRTNLQLEDELALQSPGELMHSTAIIIKCIVLYTLLLRDSILNVPTTKKRNNNYVTYSLIISLSYDSNHTAIYK